MAGMPAQMKLLKAQIFKETLQDRTELPIKQKTLSTQEDTRTIMLTLIVSLGKKWEAIRISNR